jgi:hypothetical protein
MAKPDPRLTRLFIGTDLQESGPEKRGLYFVGRERSSHPTIGTRVLVARRLAATGTPANTLKAARLSKCREFEKQEETRGEASYA